MSRRLSLESGLKPFWVNCYFDCYTPSTILTHTTSKFHRTAKIINHEADMRRFFGELPVDTAGKKRRETNWIGYSMLDLRPARNALKRLKNSRSDRKRNFKKQILDFGMRILDLRYSAFFKMAERHAAQAPALRERIHHSSIDIRHSSFY